MGLKAAVVSLFVFAMLGASAALAAEPAPSENLALLAEMAAAKQEMLDLAAALEESGELSESGALELRSKVSEIENRLKGKLSLPAPLSASSASTPGYDAQYRDATRQARTASHAAAGSLPDCPPGSCLPPLCTMPQPSAGFTSGGNSTNGSTAAGPVNRHSGAAVKHLSVVIREDGASEVDFSGFSATQVSTLLEFLSEEIFAEPGETGRTSSSAGRATAEQDEEAGAGSTDLSADGLKEMAFAPLQEQLAEQQFSSGFSAGIDLAQGRVFGSLGEEGPLQLRYSLAADGSAELAIAAQDIDINALGEQGKEVASGAGNRLARMAEKLEKALRGLFD